MSLAGRHRGDGELQHHTSDARYAVYVCICAILRVEGLHPQRSQEFLLSHLQSLPGSLHCEQLRSLQAQRHRQQFNLTSSWPLSLKTLGVFYGLSFLLPPHQFYHWIGTFAELLSRMDQYENCYTMIFGKCWWSCRRPITPRLQPIGLCAKWKKKLLWKGFWGKNYVWL